MARLKLGSLAVDLQGSLGGTVFQHHRGAIIARNKVSNVQPRTPNQQRHRAAFVGAVRLWRSLSDDDRSAWLRWANAHHMPDSFGDYRPLLAPQAFTKVNTARAVFGLATTTTPPPDPTAFPTLPTGASLNTSTGEIIITTAAATNAQGYWTVYSTPGLSLGAHARPSQYRQVYAGQQPMPESTLTIDPRETSARLVFTDAQHVAVEVNRYSNEGVQMDRFRFDAVPAVIPQGPLAADMGTVAARGYLTEGAPYGGQPTWTNANGWILWRFAPNNQWLYGTSPAGQNWTYGYYCVRPDPEGAYTPYNATAPGGTITGF